MKILHVDTGCEWRGGQAQVFYLIKNLPERIENHLLTPPDSELQARLETENIDVNIENHALRGEWDLSAAWKISKLHKKHGYDLIHAHSSHALGITWASSLLFSLPPYIETRRLELKVGKNWFSRRKYSSASNHIAISKPVKESLVQSGIESKEIVVIPSGFDLNDIEHARPALGLLKELNINSEKPIIGNVGALTAQKDQETFIRTAKLVNEKISGVQFVIAGKGELREKLEYLVEELGLQDTVFLTGFQDDILGLIKTFDLFVLTSIFEGLCSTLLQVMACKVPIVANPVGGVSDLIEDELTGKTVKNHNPKEYSKQILSFFEKKDTFSLLAERASERAEKFSMDSLAPRIADLYLQFRENTDNIDS